jgi:hypothetical protein
LQLGEDEPLRRIDLAILAVERERALPSLADPAPLASYAQVDLADRDIVPAPVVKRVFSTGHPGGSERLKYCLGTGRAS